MNVVGHHFPQQRSHAGRAEVLKEKMEVNWHSTRERFGWQVGISLAQGVLNVLSYSDAGSISFTMERLRKYQHEQQQRKTQKYAKLNYSLNSQFFSFLLFNTILCRTTFHLKIPMRSKETQCIGLCFCLVVDKFLHNKSLILIFH